MIKQLDSEYKDTLVYELDGEITKEDVDIIGEGIEFTVKEFDKVNLMLCINVSGQSFSALAEELKLGMKNWNNIHKIAYLSDKKQLDALIKLDNIFTKFEEKYFDVDDIANAWDWIIK